MMLTESVFFFSLPSVSVSSLLYLFKCEQKATAASQLLPDSRREIEAVQVAGVGEAGLAGR